jgi:hypothetical protein
MFPDDALDEIVRVLEAEARRMEQVEDDEQVAQEAS